VKHGTARGRFPTIKSASILSYDHTKPLITSISENFAEDTTPSNMYPFPLYLQSALMQAKVSLVSDHARGHGKTSNHTSPIKKSYSGTDLPGVWVVSRPKFTRSVSLPQMRSGSKSGICRWQSTPDIEKGAKDATPKMVLPRRTSDIKKCAKDVTPKMVRPRKTSGSEGRPFPTRIDVV
jgi:hypothetical protein